MSYWILTHSGQHLDLLNPDPNDIDIDTVATVLGRVPHWNGHTVVPISIAAHSIDVLNRMDRKLSQAEPVLQLSPAELKAYALIALLHDAHEAYVGDVSRPMQAAMGGDFNEIARNMQEACFVAFGVLDYWLTMDERVTEMLEEADDESLEVESICFMRENPFGSDGHVPPRLRFYPPYAGPESTALFLETYHRLRTNLDRFEEIDRKQDEDRELQSIPIWTPFI